LRGLAGVRFTWGFICRIRSRCVLAFVYTLIFREAAVTGAYCSCGISKDLHRFIAAYVVSIMLYHATREFIGIEVYHVSYIVRPQRTLC